MNPKLAYAIAAILGGTSFGAAAAAPVSGPSEAGIGSLEEIIVTAQHRNEGMQDVPIAMQAFTESTLAQLNITNFDDYVKYLPNVSSASNGPGQSEIYMRGLSAGAQQFQGRGSTGSFPNVAVWRRRFVQDRISGLYDEIRPGKPRSIDDERIAALIQKTLHKKPRD